MICIYKICCLALDTLNLVQGKSPRLSVITCWRNIADFSVRLLPAAFTWKWWIPYVFSKNCCGTEFYHFNISWWKGWWFHLTTKKSNWMFPSLIKILVTLKFITCFYVYMLRVFIIFFLPSNSLNEKSFWAFSSFYEHWDSI